MKQFKLTEDAHGVRATMSDDEGSHLMELSEAEGTFLLVTLNEALQLVAQRRREAVDTLIEGK